MKERLIECCKILGVTPSSTGIEIKQAYRNQMKKYHPDNKQVTADEEQCKLITTAYQDLKQNFEVLKEIDANEYDLKKAESEENKRFLYYVDSRRVPRHWDGQAIWQDVFIDIERNIGVTLYSSDAWEDMVEAGYECYSADPNDYENIFHIIWKKYLSENNAVSIRPISVPFDDVHSRYLEKKESGMEREQIIEEMILEFNKGQKPMTKKQILG